MAFVLDASVALSWLFADEESEAGEEIAQLAFADQAVVPNHWYVEVMNGLVRGERRRRTSPADAAPFLDRLADMEIRADELDTARIVQVLLPLARAHRLSVYDAAYLELAGREGLPLATLDESLAAAARLIGVNVIGAKEV